MSLDPNRLITATTVMPIYKTWLTVKTIGHEGYLKYLEDKIQELRNPVSVSNKAMEVGHTGERMIIAGIKEKQLKKNTYIFHNFTHYYELTDNGILNTAFGATPDLLTKTRFDDGTVITRTYEIKTIQTNFERLANAMIEKDMFQTQWQSFICESDEIVYITAVVAILERGEVKIMSEIPHLVKPDFNLHNHFIDFCNQTIDVIATIHGIKFNFNKNNKTKKGVF